MHLSFQIADAPDREGLVAELWADDVMWGEIEIPDERAEPTIELYGSVTGEPWKFNLREMEETMQRALARISEMKKI